MKRAAQRGATTIGALYRAVDVLIVGAGHSGLAMSHELTARGIDHRILERSVVGSAWRTRWDSLRLLTPSWQTRLPGHEYEGADPDGFMSRDEVVRFLDAYARNIAAPVHTDTNVLSIVRDGDRYVADTTRGRFRCRAVVLATGAHAKAAIPPLGRLLPAGVTGVPSHEYRNPGALPDGGVLVVGASATGVQLADELLSAGRRVTLAVGEHVRIPRTYRGLDIQRWLDAAGILDQRYDQVDDLVRARRVPSPQLVGRKDGVLLDLNALRERGARITGRLVGVSGGHLQFSGSLANHCVMADLKLGRLLRLLDAHAEASGLSRELPPPERYPATQVEVSPDLSLDVAAERLGAVVWATGSRPDFGYLRVPVFDPQGRLRHDGGVVAAPGLYALGLNFLRRRKSSFIHGAEDDVRDLGGHLARYLDANAPSSGPPSRAASG